MHVKNIIYKEFEKIKISDNSIVIFYIKWSGTSQLMKPILENIAARFYEKISFYSVEITDPGNVMLKDLRIHFFPTYVFVKNGVPLSLMSGTFSSDDLLERIQQFVEEDLEK